ncbi:MAG: ArnT family glycosyltransferase [Candidatus Komeilibacteria bacterium]
MLNISLKQTKGSLDWHWIFLGVVAIIFFVAYSWPSFISLQNVEKTGRPIFNSPDETANYWASTQFYQSGQFHQFSEPSLVGGDIVKPRSLRIINNYLSPTGFLGLPWLYGSIARLFDRADIIIWLTPLLAAVGGLLFYGLIKAIFDRRTALLSALLLWILPAYWYYAGRAMMPNVLLMVLVIAALWFLWQALSSRYWWSYAAAGLMFGLALFVRSSEIVWLLPLGLLFLLCRWRQIHWAYVWFIPIFALVALLPMFYHNTMLYNSPWSIGYQLVNGQEVSSWQSLTNYLLPFGWHPEVLRRNVANYLHYLFNWQTVIFIVALFLFILAAIRRQANSRSQWAYLFSFGVVALILVIYYGSWSFHDNPDPSAVTIGTSFVRYWLPIYIMTLPIIAWSVQWIFSRHKLAWISAAAALFLFSFSFAWHQVILDGDESWQAMNYQIERYEQMSTLVNEKTATDAIIIARRSDKVFWPTRTVIYDLFYPIDWQRLARLADQYPVYLWDWQYDLADIAYLNQRDYKKYDLELGITDISYDNMALYKINLEYDGQ